MRQDFKALFFGTLLNDGKLLNICWLIFRAHIGFSIAIHAGLPKMLEITAPSWFSNQVSDLGFTFPSPMFWATIAAWGEFIGGLMIAFGICTKLGALQLAFQFFVVSFLWYDEPEFLTGMYYQQLLFWAFLIIGFIGAGKYSFDWQIIKNEKRKVQKPISIVLFFIFTMTFLNKVEAQNKPLVGSGKLKEATYDFKDFDKVKFIGMNGIVNVNLGQNFKQNIKIDDNLLPLLNATVSNGILLIELKGNESNKFYIENTNIKVEISMPELSVFEYNGNGLVTINNFTGRYLKIENKGNADIKIKGSICDEFEINNDGNGDIDATMISSKSINLVKDGNGDIKIRTDNIFKIKGEGNGDIINYGKGKALIDGSFTGNGEVIYKY